jgi:hypothetical protein
MQNSTAALVAKIAVLFAATVAGARKVGHIGTVGNTEEGENSRGSKGRCGLAPAFYAVAVVDIEGSGCRSREGDSAASTAAVHVVVEMVGGERVTGVPMTENG